MTGGFRVGGVAAVLTLASLFGAYSFFLESLNDAGGLEDGGNLSSASTPAGSSTTLAKENQELKESLSHLRAKYEDLMAYMKERCYADDGERQKHMNSLCQTELDVCKGSLIAERADRKRLSGSMDKLDDKALALHQNLTKVRKDKEAAFREAGKLVDRLEKHHSSESKKEQKLKGAIEKNLQQEEAKLSGILKSNGFDLNPKRVDMLTSFDDDDEEEEAGGDGGTQKTKAKKPKLHVSISPSGNTTQADVDRVRALLPSILQALPTPERKLAQQLGGDIKHHQKELRLLEDDDDDDDDDDDEDLSPRDPAAHQRMQGFKKSLKRHRRDARPDLHDLLQVCVCVCV